MMTVTACPMCSRWETDSDLRITELEFSCAVLNRDQYFPGYTLLFTKSHVTELFHLDRQVRAAVMEELSMMAESLYSAFSPAKINYELLGNMVPHIHWHVVPRFRTDSHWPRPVWAEPHEELFLQPDEYRQRIELIRSFMP